MPEDLPIETPEWVQNIINATRDMLKHHELSPVSFIKKGEEIYVITLDELPQNTQIPVKDLFAAYTRRSAIKLDADAVLIVSEVWARTPAPDEDLNNMKVAVRDHPDSKECIFMVLETKKGTWSAQSDIQGVLPTRFFVELKFYPVSTQGRLSTMLPDKDAPTQQV